MENPGELPTKKVDSDVALLYSWAKIENTPYRDFARQRTPQPADSPTEATETSQEARPETRPETPDTQAPPRLIFRETSAPANTPPILAVYSLAGGTGKTTLCANLGKILCSLGEQVLLIDATGRGLLPFYFGATELRTGLRKFAAPGLNAPFVQILTGDEITPQWIENEVKPKMPAAQRTIFDLGQGSQAALPAVLNLCTAVLVPLSPDLNSVVSVPILENFLQANSSVYYVFNYFDERSPQCRHARDFVLRHCGNRLLPISLRRDRETQVTDKDTETGMFGADQLPGLELAADYMELALWIRRVAPLTAAALVPARWSEQ